MMTATLLLVALLTASAAQAGAQPMQYFVSGRQKEPVDREQQKVREKALKEAIV